MLSSPRTEAIIVGQLPTPSLCKIVQATSENRPPDVAVSNLSRRLPRRRRRAHSSMAHVQGRPSTALIPIVRITLQEPQHLLEIDVYDDRGHLTDPGQPWREPLRQEKDVACRMLNGCVKSDEQRHPQVSLLDVRPQFCNASLQLWQGIVMVAFSRARICLT